MRVLEATRRTRWPRQTQKARLLTLVALTLCAFMLAASLAGCAPSDSSDLAKGTSDEEGKTLVYGTTGYGVQMDDAGLNPHENYSGWSAVRYGVAETLFKFSDEMTPEPWLATSYAFTDQTHCTITLQDNVTFTSGRALDAQAVKECLDDLVAVHQRAAQDLKIARIDVDDRLTLTITTTEPCPSLINYLCDPYSAIIDMQAGVSADSNVSGTGPYQATSVADTSVTLVKNPTYWNGEPKLDSIVVYAITDGDTLTSALQTGELDAVYGLPYESYSIFDDESEYTIASCNTTRTFFGQVNYSSPIMQDDAVRQALALGLDKEGFIHALLNGRGVVAQGPFTDSMPFGDGTVSGAAYDPDEAKRILEEAGWVDQDGDGIREKDGQRLTIRWLTYPGRIELPLLAQAAQGMLEDLGMEVQILNTESHTQIRTDPSAWDVYVSALVTAPTGDPEYFFGATCLDDSTQNFGQYHNDELNRLAAQLHATFDQDERSQLATQMQQVLLDDYGYFFVSHLTMGIVSQANVTGLEPHPCDYYEITVDVDKN